MTYQAGLLLCAWLWPLSVSVAAEPVPTSYPVRPIRIIVPQAPGGQTDLTARQVAPALSERLGQSVVVDNRPGAGGLMGTNLVAKAAPDGYTLLVVASSFTIVSNMYKKLPFDPVADFAPVTMLSSYPNVLVVHPAVPANSVRELITLAKAKPGTLNYASGGGTGTNTHLLAELFKSMAGIDIVHLPYKGGGPALIAVIGGEADLYFATISSALPFIKAGKLKALAVTSKKRSPVAPDLPTVAETGLPGYDQSGWIGMLAPAYTPPGILKKLNGEVEAILKMPVTRERFTADGAVPAGISPEEFTTIIKSEITHWATVIRQAGIKPE